MFEDTNKSIIFEEFLMGLSKVCESEDELSALFNKACELYKDNWRHSYSFVTKTILKQMEKQPLNGVLSLNDTLYTIFDNLKSLNGKICQLLKSHKDQFEFFKSETRINRWIVSIIIILCLAITLILGILGMELSALAPCFIPIALLITRLFNK